MVIYGYVKKRKFYLLNTHAKVFTGEICQIALKHCSKKKNEWRRDKTRIRKC